MNKLFKFMHSQGFSPVEDKMCLYAPNETEGATDILDRHGYIKHDTLFTENNNTWIVIYSSSDEKCKYEYIIEIADDCQSHYIPCDNFIDYLEFLHKYLPTIEKINVISEQVPSIYLK